MTSFASPASFVASPGAAPDAARGSVVNPIVPAVPSDPASGPGPQAPDPGVHLGLAVWRPRAGDGAFHHLDVKGYRVTAGLPRSASANLPTLHAEFGAACRCANRRTVHFGLTDAALEFLPAARPHARRYLGDMPVFDLARWRDASGIPRGIRAQERRARNHGVVVRHLAAAPSDPSLLAELAACRDAWLRAKPLPPLRFMTTPFLFDPWPAEGVFVAERGGSVTGFLTASRALFGGVFRVDAVVRAPGAPNGCAELLVCEAFRHAAARGAAQATLGLAPLSRRASSVRGGDRLTAVARRLGAPFYSFAGLEAFKARFAPDAWVPLYCVAPGPRFAARDLLAVARAFAGGSLRAYAARALAWRMTASRRRVV